MMKASVGRTFLYSAGVLLLGTALAKFVSASGSARILQSPDPIFSIPFRLLFWVVGSIEAVIALVCLFGRRTFLQAGLVAWLATNFVVYRLGLWWVGYHRPCPCLGNLTDAIHIPPGTTDAGIKIILAYLLISSYGTLILLWRQKRKSTLSSEPGETAVSTA